MDAMQAAQGAEGLIVDIPEESAGGVDGDHVEQGEAFRAAHTDAEPADGLKPR
jgi:hypothetical protein